MFFFFSYLFVFLHFFKDMMRGKPGYEHLNKPLHLLLEIVDDRLMQAHEILEDLLKPVVSNLIPSPSPVCAIVLFLYWVVLSD